MLVRLLLAVVSLITTAVWSFALDYSKPPKCDYSPSVARTTPYFAIGEKMFICLFVTAGPQKMHSMAFFITVDTYSSLQLSGAVNKLGVPTGSTPEEGFYMWASTPRKVVGPIDTTVATTGTSFASSKAKNPVAAWPKDCGDNVDTSIEEPGPAVQATNPATYTTQVISSCPFMFNSDLYTIPILSLVVNMDQGNVTSLAWDNQCMTCSSNSPQCLKGYKGMMLDGLDAAMQIIPDSTSGQYLTGGCGTERTLCVAATSTSSTTTSSNICDPKILVTFSGTDRNGRQLTTAGLRISQFAGLAISSLWQSVKYSFVPPSSDVPGEDVVNAVEGAETDDAEAPAHKPNKN